MGSKALLLFLIAILVRLPGFAQAPETPSLTIASGNNAQSQVPLSLPAVNETSWAAQSSGTSIPLLGAHSVNADVAWAGGGDGQGIIGIILRTTNGGATWSQAGHPNGDVYAISGIDESTAIATNWTLSADPCLLKTLNGGTTWRTVNSAVLGFYNDVQMITAMTGHCVLRGLTGYYVINTTDGGETWSGLPPPSPTSEVFNAMFWYDSLHAWIGTNNSHIYRTTNGGATWESSGTTFVSSWSLYFTTPDIGLAGSNTGAINRTTDGGVSWTTAPTSLPTAVLSMSGLRGTQEFWAASGTWLNYSSNAGDSWTHAGPNGYGGAQQINCISMAFEGGNVFGLAVGNSGLILRYRRITSDVSGIKTELPAQFSLFQNYPNPFNPSTTIGYHLPYQCHVSLKVYDMLGREIATLVDGVEAPGYKSTVWEARGVASGVYYYRLQADDFVASKKLLLLK